MQKLWLKDFEYNISPVTWQTAQELVQQGRVKHLREVEKHFWLALVESEEGIFETEIVLTPNKIRAFTCECWTEGRKMICAHVAAGLLRIRQFLEQQTQERRERAATPQGEVSRLTVQSVLDTLSPEDLIQFVREYARRDRDFALTLKTWFAGGITGADNPFLLVFDAVLPRSGNAKPIRETDMRRLRKTLDDLQQQLEAADRLQNHRRVYQIGTAIVEKLCPLLHKLDEVRRPALLPYVQQAVRYLTQKPGERPPELREAIWSSLLDLPARGLFPPEAESILIEALSEAASADEAKFEQLYALFVNMPYPAPPVILHLFITALASRQGSAAVLRVLEDYTENPILIKDAVFQLYIQKKWQAAAAAADAFLQQNIFTPAQRRDLEDLLFNLAQKTADQPLLLRLLRRRFRQHGSADIYQQLQKEAGAQWPEERERLKQELEESGNADRLASMFAGENNMTELIQLLKQRPEFELVRQYETPLLSADRSFVRDRYIAYLAAHLTEHFGRQAANYVREQLIGLVKKQEYNLTLDIIKALCDRFPDRQSLTEELVDLLPKTYRKELVQANDPS